jgi:hypothetical protein
MPGQFPLESLSQIKAVKYLIHVLKETDRDRFDSVRDINVKSRQFFDSGVLS